MPTPKSRKMRKGKPMKKASKPQAAVRSSDAARDRSLREHVLSLLRGGNAHVGFEQTIAEFPADKWGAKPAGAPHSAWQLLEHLRLAQWDIVEFSLNPKHVSPEFPKGYWPESESPPSAAAWNKSLEAFRRDLKRMERLVSDPKMDLYARLSHGEGQTLLREALLLADHNSYHLGQLLTLRRLLGAWPG